MNIEGYLRSKINRKIIRFFLENPSSLDNSRGIGTWINENKNKTEKALKDLLEAKILIAHGKDATAAYGFTTNTRINAKIKTCLKKSKKTR